MTAWLEENHSYKVAFGSTGFNLPNYDIGYFKDSIPDNASVIEPAAVKVYDKPKEVVAVSPTIFTDRNIIWVAIFLVIGVLGFMSVRMLREKQSH